MRIEEFNALPRDEAEAALRVCADVDGWVRTLVDERPYPDVRSLVTAAEHLADDWTVDDVEKALAHHPRIGER
ncbi:MAG TPA: 2-oxo-4-hydroxy-4-carboxy-5-ureidoimidazoline decarboxylase, partial [Nocardioides sp.]|nr:2-oxo-4-hydroxy-4-carboxy-5-ureidoimidazoline decarboxylase [Nocardioides sp.]